MRLEDKREEKVAEWLLESLNSANTGNYEIVESSTFEEAGLLTCDKGIVLKVVDEDDSNVESTLYTIQLTIQAYDEN